MKNYFFPIFVFLAMGAIFLYGAIFLQNKLFGDIADISTSSLYSAIAVPEPAAARQNNKVVLMAVGDIMLDRGVEYKIKKEGKGDFKFPFLKIADYLQGADILFGNLESVISDKGKNVGSSNSFRADPSAIEGLNHAGFDVISVANNHIYDYSEAAMKDSFERLGRAGIEYAGGGFNENEAFSAKVEEVKNVRIGFLAYNNFNLGSRFWRATADRPGIALVSEEDLQRMENDIREAKKKADILIVSFHWGDEYTFVPNDFQVVFARALIDAGTDLIIGHHPHVVQPVEKYKNGWIAYSLGNFVFDQGFSKETMSGLLLEVTIRNKKIEGVASKDIKILDSFQPTLPIASD